LNDLSFLLNPKSIAILGASADFAKVNGRTVKYLLAKGYAGRIYPVNPKYSRIAQLTCYPDIDAIPGAVDLAVIALPARFVTQAVKDLGRRGAKAAVVFSSGFAETGAEGRALEEGLIAAAETAGVRLCGPNCLGLINAFEHVVATFGQFAEGDTPAGPVAFVTQSGAFGTAIAALARRRGLGLGYFINTGNEGDVDFSAIMSAVLKDARIAVGAGYIEGLKDGPGFLALAEQALAQGKPLVITKVGRTPAGARAAVSHTGSLAGTDDVFEGVTRGLGIQRARNEEQMLDVVEAFAYCALPKGQGVGIITQSGGAGALMADHAEESGLSVPTLNTTTQHALRDSIPAFGATGNPVDVTGQFVAEPRLLENAVTLVLSDPAIDVAIIWLQLMEGYVDTLVGIFERLKAKTEKPFLVCWVAAPERAIHALRERGIPVLRGGEPAVDAAAALVHYAEARRRWIADSKARNAVRNKLTQDAATLSVGPGVVPTATAAAWLNAFGVATAAVRLAKTPGEAVAVAAAIGYPVALKIESPDLPHKMEVQGVKLNLGDANSVRQAYAEIVSNAGRCRPDACIEGVIVQRMAEAGVELVVGLKRDSVFGMVVMVGLGGIHIEVLKDVVFRRTPVTLQEAERMLNELRGRALLDGVRGRPGVDRTALCRFISTVSVVGATVGPGLRELDLNPVFANAEGVIAVDWLLVMD